MFHDLILLLGILAVTAGFSLAFLSQRYWFARACFSCVSLATVLVCARLEICGAHSAAGMAHRDARSVAHASGDDRADCHKRHCAELARHDFPRVLVDAFLRPVDVEFDLFVPIHQDNCRRGLAVAAPALQIFGCVAHFGGVETVNHSRRYFFHAAGVLAGAVPFVSAAYGFIGERLRFQVREVEIRIANLPPALDGLHITQLSDIHVGSYMPVAQVRRAVGMANELHGDLVVVTGDFLTGRTDPLEDCITELSRLRAPMGVWGCNGNHEIYAGAEAEAAALFSRFGMKLLRHESAELNWRGSALNLIGVDYQRQRGGDGSRAVMLAGLEPLIRRDVPNILLSHNPNSFPRAAELGIELSLAGHTHGGQVRVEILDHPWSPAEFLTPYVAGLYRRPLLASSNLSDAGVVSLLPTSSLQTPASSTIYVNRGLGTIGAPVRLGVPPEITLLTLRRA